MNQVGLFSFIWIQLMFLEVEAYYLHYYNEHTINNSNNNIVGKDASCK